MRVGTLLSLLVALGFMCAVQDARAGAFRFVGKKIAQGSTAVAGATVDGAQAAGGGMAAAGKTTGGALKTGAVGFGKGVKAAPSVVAHGAKAVGKAIW